MALAWATGSSAAGAGSDGPCAGVPAEGAALALPPAAAATVAGAASLLPA